MALSLSTFGLTEGVNEEFPNLIISVGGTEYAESRGANFIICVRGSCGEFLCNLMVVSSGLRWGAVSDFRGGRITNILELRSIIALTVKVGGYEVQGDGCE